MSNPEPSADSSVEKVAQDDLCCWVVRYDDLGENPTERYLGTYPTAQETNPICEIMIAGWSK